MTINRGKEFEDIVRRDFKKVENTIVIRLYDTMNGYSVKNPCDLIVYNSPIMFLIECKCCHGASLPIKNITEFQWQSLLEAGKVDGVVAGYLIWFIDKDVTVFVPAENMKRYTEVYNSKSFSYQDSFKYGTPVIGTKKRTFFEYDMKGFINDIKNGQ